MPRARKLIASAGLTAMMLAGFGADAALAHEGPTSPDRPGADVRIVHDPGLDTGRRTDSTPNLAVCYDGQKPWDAGLDDTDGDSHAIPGWDDTPDSAVGDTPVYVASNRCNDVNIRITSDLTETLVLRTCFYPASTPDYCNQWTEIQPGDDGWRLPATSLIDGTRFRVQFANPSDHLEGYIAY